MFGWDILPLHEMFLTSFLLSFVPYWLSKFLFTIVEFFLSHMSKASRKRLYRQCCSKLHLITVSYAFFKENKHHSVANVYIQLLKYIRIGTSACSMVLVYFNSLFLKTTGARNHNCLTSVITCWTHRTRELLRTMAEWRINFSRRKGSQHSSNLTHKAFPE